jgi:16S rRNA (cytosine1402-N4)-methyltransferase
MGVRGHAGAIPPPARRVHRPVVLQGGRADSRFARGVELDEHSAVLVDEVLDALAPVTDGFYVDATFGRGGHTQKILEALGAAGRVLALDRDPEAITSGAARFAAEPRLTLLHASFDRLAAFALQYAPGRACRGVLFDLGVSSPQLDQARRGFSFQHDGPLDMRMDPTQGESAAQWLARASVDEIRRVIAEFGEERFAQRIARAIERARLDRPLATTAQLASVVARAVPTREPGKHPATRTFQAIRMQVNDELGQLERGLAAAHQLLTVSGRLVVISFHSLEDRLVKNFMRRHASVDPALAGLPVVPAQAQPTLALRGRKHRPGEDERARNPRSRSAVLRVAEKIR